MGSDAHKILLLPPGTDGFAWFRSVAAARGATGAHAWVEPAGPADLALGIEVLGLADVRGFVLGEGEVADPGADLAARLKPMPGVEMELTYRREGPTMAPWADLPAPRPGPVRECAAVRLSPGEDSWTLEAYFGSHREGVEEEPSDEDLDHYDRLVAWWSARRFAVGADLAARMGVPLPYAMVDGQPVPRPGGTPRVEPGWEDAEEVWAARVHERPEAAVARLAEGLRAGGFTRWMVTLKGACARLHAHAAAAGPAPWTAASVHVFPGLPLGEVRAVPGWQGRIRWTAGLRWSEADNEAISEDYDQYALRGLSLEVDQAGDAVTVAVSTVGLSEEAADRIAVRLGALPGGRLRVSA